MMVNDVCRRIIYNVLWYPMGNVEVGERGKTQNSHMRSVARVLYILPRTAEGAGT